MKVKTLISILQRTIDDLGEDAELVFYHLENYSLSGDFHLETIIPFDAESDDGPPWVEMTLGRYDEVSADSGNCGCCNRIDE